MAKKLDNREKRFVNEYLIDLDPQRAAVAAGYSQTVARTRAYEWVSNNQIKTHVFEEIQRKIKARESRTEISQDKVIRELARIALADPRTVASWDQFGVKLKDSETLTDDQAAAIESVSSTPGKEGVSFRFKMHSKLTALELLGKHLNLFKEPLPLEVLINALPDPIRSVVRQSLCATLSHENDSGGDSDKPDRP